MKILYDPEKMINDGRYKVLYSKIDSEKRTKIINKIDKLIKNEKEYCDDKNYAHLCNIFPAIAIYKTLIEDGIEKDEAFKMVSEYMWTALEPLKESYEKMSKIPGFIFLMKMIVPKMFAKASGKGWEYSYPKSPRNGFYFECHQCIYAQLFPKYNVSELGPMFCHADEINFGSLHNIEFKRKGTLCKGAEKCDFLFIKK